ncbi:hypothetical protein L6164_002504 [Bauhinia variegata]|uniref:Uncharacterized protein n=1 Tax=Bauhinia variegata TaxID=167791 RepID=A0ACB9PYZ7_BAUVA|nr:hypothetical protein L6164_002504 [Bauhinia variegata]
MNSLSDNHGTDSGELDSEDGSSCGINMGHIFNFRNEVEATHRMILVQWINGLLPSLCLPINIMDDELRARLSNGYVLCQILNKLVPGSVSVDDFDNSVSSQTENVNKFLKTMDRLGLPHFKISDLQKGSIKVVVDCLLTLRAKSLQNCLVDKISTSSSKSESPRSPSRIFCSSPSKEPKEDQKKLSFASKFQRVLRGPVTSEPSAAPAPTHPVDQKVQDVFQLKGSYADLSAAKISEIMKSNSLDNAPTQSLLSLVNGILEESIERKNGDIPHRLACLLRRVVQEIERRVSTQTEHLRTQNNLFKAREEKYQSRIKVLDALASGTKEESEIGTSQLQQLKTDKTEEEEKKKASEDVIRLMKDQEEKNMEISTLKQELETTKKLYELQRSQLEAAAKGAAEDVARMMKDQDDKNEEISRLKQELETTIKTYELRCSQLEAEAKSAKLELEHKSKEYNHLIEDLRNKEASSESKYQNWIMKKRQYQNVVDFQFRSLQQLKVLWGSIKQDITQGQSIYSEECNRLGVNLKPLVDATEKYHVVLAENRRLFNEVQELKGNIRVYCRIRPFISGQKEKRSIVEHIGENELVVANPSRQGKDAFRSFKFNKVYGPATTQVEVYSDIQPFVRSVLDGYNVCIFAYGQTGSGKTYTMSGPNNATTETLGVNYRALNDLFSILKSRTSTFSYEIGVQMVEIYNEQVRDLLLTDGSPRKYPFPRIMAN